MASRRKLQATFSHGLVINRHTTNPDLKWAWFAQGRFKPQIGKAAEPVRYDHGFSSTQHLARQAASRFEKYWPIEFRTEVVECVELEKGNRSPNLPKLNADQLTAIDVLKDSYGISWKKALRRLWKMGKAGDQLQPMYQSHGMNWLSRYKGE